MLRISLLVFALLCISVLKINSDEDLYKVLGVSSSSSKKEIKAAYKKLAMEWFVFIHLRQKSHTLIQ